MIALVALDLFCVVLILVGFQLAFRQGAVRSLLGRPPAEGPDELASVFRIAGVMLMAFGATICAFANLIAYFSAHSAY